MRRSAKKIIHSKKSPVKKSLFASRLTIIFVSMIASFLLSIIAFTGYIIVASRPIQSQEIATKNGVEEYTEQPATNDQQVKGTTNNSAIILHGSRDSKKIALTFDAEMTQGMKQYVLSGHSSYDSRIIDTLIETHTKATLFITGMWAELYPDKVQSFAKNPLFEIGSHSYADTSFSGYCYGLSPTPNTNDLQDIQATQKILKSLTGQDNTLFRFPGGCYDDFDIDTVVNKAHLTIVHWDVVGGDGFNNNTQSIVNAVVNRVKNGSIIVLHMNGAPTAPHTADALPSIISILKQKGYQFVTVSQLLGLN